MGSNYPMPPQAAPKKPGAIGFILGIVVIVLGVAGGFLLFMPHMLTDSAHVRDAQAYPADGSYYSVSLNGGQQLGLWITTDGVGNCDVEDPSGNSVSMNTDLTGTQTVDNYQLVAEFTPSTTDVYQVGCQATTVDFQFKVAPPLFSGGVNSLFNSLIIGLIVMGAGFMIGLILIIVTGVRRSSWTKQHGQPPMPLPGQAWGPQPQYPPQAPQPQQFAPQPPVRPQLPQQYAPQMPQPAQYAPQAPQYAPPPTQYAPQPQQYAPQPQAPQYAPQAPQPPQYPPQAPQYPPQAQYPPR